MSENKKNLSSKYSDFSCDNKYKVGFELHINCMNIADDDFKFRLDHLFLPETEQLDEFKCVVQYFIERVISLPLKVYIYCKWPIVNHRKLNNIMINDKYLIPIIDDILD